MNKKPGVMGQFAVIECGCWGQRIDSRKGSVSRKSSVSRKGSVSRKSIVSRKSSVSRKSIKSKQCSRI